jgi:hypothetical protein
MDDGVVPRAQERRVGKVCGSAIDPVGDVVGVAPGGSGLAAGEAAVLVAQPEGTDLGGGEKPFGASLLEDLAGRPEDERG